MIPTTRYSSIRRLGPHTLALILYAALTVVALDNLVLHFSTAVLSVGEWDYAIYYWNLWWVKYALFHLHRDPMFTNYVLYPNNINLSLTNLGLTLGLVTAPLQGILDLKLIYNGLIVGAFIATGYCTFLFLRRHAQNDWLAALGGAMFTFTPTTLSFASKGQIHLLQTWWLPLLLLLWDSVIARRKMRWRVLAAVGLGCGLYLAWMTGVELVLWGAILLVAYGLYTWLARCQGRERLIVAGLALVAGVSMLAPALIEPIPAMLQTRTMVFPIIGLGTVEYYSYQLSWLVTRDPDRLGDSIGQLVPLLTLLSVPLAGPRRWRWLWLAVGLVLFVLALGPVLSGTQIPLPYLWVHGLLGEQYRTPIRFMTPALFALITFVTLSLAGAFERRIAPRWQPWLVSAALVGLVFDSSMLDPMSIGFITDYRIYHTIGRDPEEYALLEVPVSPASGFGELGGAPDLQYYSQFHHKQIINGIVSRVPSSALDRFSRSPLLSGLTGEHAFPPLDVAGRELADKLNRWDMRYVLVHRDRLKPERARTIVAFFNVQPELCLVDEEGDLLAYRRIDAWADCPKPEMSALPAGVSRLVLGDPGHARYIGPGWYDIENVDGVDVRWAGEIPTSTLRLLLTPVNTHVRFRAAAYPADQTVTISVNGRPVTTIQLVNDWAEYEFVIPVDVLRADGPSVITLTHARLESPLEHTGGATPDPNPLAAAYDYFAFEPAR